MKSESTFDFHIRWAWARISRLYNQQAAEYGGTMSIGYALLNIDREGMPSTKLGPKMGLTIEGRYTWAEADMDADFVGFDPIDFAIPVGIKKVKLNVTGKMSGDFVPLQISVPVPIQFRKMKTWQANTFS